MRLYSTSINEDYLSASPPSLPDGRWFYEWEASDVSVIGSAKSLLVDIDEKIADNCGADDETFPVRDPELVALAQQLIDAINAKTVWKVASNLLAVHYVGAPENDPPHAYEMSMSADYYERSFVKLHNMDVNVEIKQGNLWTGDRVGWFDPVAGIQHDPEGAS